MMYESRFCKIDACRAEFVPVTGKQIYCSTKCCLKARYAAKCYCGAKLGEDGKCVWECPPEADPDHLAKIDERIREQEAYRRADDHWTITAEERQKSDAAMAKFDRFYKQSRRQGRRAARARHGLRIAKKKAVS